MKKNSVSSLLIGNQFIKLDENHDDISVTSGIVHEERWIDMLEIPLITFEKNTRIYANSFNRSQKDGKTYKLELNREKEDEYSVLMKITHLSSEDGHNWMKIQVNIFFPREVQFEQYIPEIKMSFIPKLSNVDQLVFINQPSRHTPPTEEWKSNDMPAGYIWNPESNIATIFFVNFSEMKWMSSEIIERFSNYECGYQPSNFFGLLQRGLLEKKVLIPANFNMNFEFFIKYPQGF